MSIVKIQYVCAYIGEWKMKRDYEMIRENIFDEELYRNGRKKGINR